MDQDNSNNFNHRTEPAPSVLYVVGTPIGNLQDLSSRAKLILSNVSLIACEDTRRSQILLKTFNATTPLLSFHKHNTKSRIPKILDFLNEGKSIALISDAGLPGISDPGEELISSSKKKGYEVICIPGPCAATTALVSSGIKSERFCFEGFLPSKQKARKKILDNISTEERTIIIFESPHKLLKLLNELIEICGPTRSISISRELTKHYEETIKGTLPEVISHFQEKKPKGEFTLVLEGNLENQIKSKVELLTELHLLIDQGKSHSDAVKQISQENGYSRRLLYELLHQKPL